MLLKIILWPHVSLGWTGWTHSETKRALKQRKRR